MLTNIQIPALTVCTGRIRTFVEQPEKGTMAPSCTLYVYDNDLEECLLFVDRALRGGAGVKVQLEKFVPRKPVEVNWAFSLSPKHPDFLLVAKDKKVNDRFFTKVDNPAWIEVADSMEESDRKYISIRDSWIRFIKGAMRGESMVVDLSALRPAGTQNSLGLTATGPLGYGDGDGSFLSVYEAIANHLEKGDLISLMQLLGQLNRVLRRGGAYKNGIVTNAIHYKHPDIRTYLEFPLSKLPGGHKKGVRVDEGILEDRELCELVVRQLNYGGLFSEKILGDDLYSNVCEEILMKHRGVCLLSHANAAACSSPEKLIDALVETVVFLTDLHLTWREKVGTKADMYLPLEQDRQIGVGWCGLANFLRRMGVTYQQHVEALEASLNGEPYHQSGLASDIAECLIAGYFKATKKCDDKMVGVGHEPLERIWTMAPCQRNFTDYKDPDGYILCRSIDPPFNQVERRDSHTDVASARHYNHGSVEIALEVGHDLHQRHWEAWQQMMNLTGRAHTMSFDLWKRVDMDWFRDFVTRSPLKTTYYQFADRLDQQYLNKGQIWEAVEACDLDEGCVNCAE